MADSPMMVGPASGTRRLLIVGDVALSRALIEMVLSRLGYTVTCVASGQDALRALGHTRHALALIAVHLPDLPGLTLARRLRGGAGPVGAMPIMLFGDARHSEAVLVGCREARLEGFLPKPVSIGRLVSSVCDVVRRTGPARRRFMVAAQDEPIRLERLREFTDGDEQLERELVTLFLSTAALYLDELRGRFEHASDWSQTAHALKGASANIGAATLARLAAEAERAGPAPERLAGLDDALEEVRRLFRERWTSEASPHPATLARSS